MRYCEVPKINPALIADRALNSVSARQKKMKPFYVSCEAPVLSNREIWHSTAEEGALQVQPAMHLNVWGMSPHISDLPSVTNRV